MGKVDKGVKCMVKGCDNFAERSLSAEQVSKSSIKVEGSARRVYLCHDHYKQWKKETKKMRELEHIAY
ncbi:MAG: hypothetical protein N3F64_00050 [Nitrososphaeria archaeon]|nr:hypothetical protein [Nitrososphaeria archaeon]